MAVGWSCGFAAAGAGLLAAAEACFTWAAELGALLVALTTAGALALAAGWLAAGCGLGTVAWGLAAVAGFRVLACSCLSCCCCCALAGAGLVVG